MLKQRCRNHKIEGAKPIFDCDIHPEFADISDIYPYLTLYWRDMLQDRGIADLQTANYPPKAPISARDDWRQDGAKPAGTLAQVRAELLDRFGIGIAICNFLSGAPVLPNPDMAVEIARGTNDYIAAEWLDEEPRLRASIVIAPQDPQRAAAEIDRVARDRRFVQVLMPVSNEVMLGKRHYWPIFDACVRNNILLCVHAGSTFRYPLTAAGPTRYFYHDYASQAPAFQSQIMNLVLEGVFSQFPELRVVCGESGVTWLPSILTRADKFWRGLRMETPWVDRPPSEIIREHVRFTLTPFDIPDDARIVAEIAEQVNVDGMVLFSTDYPHWQFEGTSVIPAGLPDETIRRIATENPATWYGLV